MPRYIVKLKELYCEWSTVVDAPISYFMPLVDFEEYYKQQYGIEGLASLSTRMSRVETKGTSSRFDDSAEEVISGNRAGSDEDELTADELLQKYAMPQTG